MGWLVSFFLERVSENRSALGSSVWTGMQPSRCFRISFVNPLVLTEITHFSVSKTRTGMSAVMVRRRALATEWLTFSVNS